MKVIKANINLDLIDQSKVHQGEKGRYLKVAIIETPSNEHSTHMIKQDYGKDEFGEYIQNDTVLGNAKRWPENIPETNQSS